MKEVVQARYMCRAMQKGIWKETNVIKYNVPYKMHAGQKISMYVSIALLYDIKSGGDFK